ncbi:MAG: glycosyltransferase family 9 protein [Candidatus Omnitrophica bacterium]|nr:glycosyltransferase family 9 protein [Candidatus Omnitrophota bacterium]
MKILVIRTDRIGEVVLTLPVITALKEKWPEADISMMINPAVRELIEDNPYVKEIIEYKEYKDKEGKIRIHKGAVLGALKLKRILKEKKFDMAIIANPKKEFHLAVFLAGIPVRAGFDRKWGFFLTHRVSDRKFLAERHEVEYNLDLIRSLGIEPKNARPVLTVTDTAGHIIIEKLKKALPPGSDICRLIAVHPCTSNPKKQWPKTNFSKLADLLTQKGYNVVMICGPDEVQSAKEVISGMVNKVIDFTGALSLRELAALFKNCKFLVSSDSGPVHIAAAVGTPVVALFGRQDAGSRPMRWGPYGAGHIIIEKDRLEAITPEEVLAKIK